jgi:hypothetical protein
MRTVSSKKIMIALALISIPIAALALISAADSRAINLRTRKANELLQVSEALNGTRIDHVLHELGQPMAIAFEPGIQSLRPGTRSHPPRLRFTYEYAFRGAPWSPPYRAFLYVSVPLSKNGTIDGIWADQIFAARAPLLSSDSRRSAPRSSPTPATAPSGRSSSSPTAAMTASSSPTTAATASKRTILRSGSPAVSYTYQYDAAGNITGITDNVD